MQTSVNGHNLDGYDKVGRTGREVDILEEQQKAMDEDETEASLVARKSGTV